MVNAFYKSGLVLSIMIAIPGLVAAQQNAILKEYEKNFTTYPFSDPDPVPNRGKIYPYFRYDGFTDQPVQKLWKVVELENDYIKLQIIPEIGGKIWTAIDKQSGKPFIYENGVVKFRDIAMRGPWTSGGIESNFGIMGHTPTVATPIDYLTLKNDDGSVSCIIGALDLLTRTRWNLEIRLPKDKAYFITHVYWHNSTPIEQPYYSWMNLAVKTTDSLEFIDPGTHYIGHDGTAHSWPYDSLNNRNMSVYEQNNFGTSKSYHILGTYSNYFGAYWQKGDFGMIHYADRRDKSGKKVFVWALSGEGEIWEELLTDHSGQYSEIQSGRLFNQNVIESSRTPFKQVAFTPYKTDTWTEYWYPFKNTGGLLSADLNGVINLRQHQDSLEICFSAVSNISDTLRLFGPNRRVLFEQQIQLQPMQVYRKMISLAKSEKPVHMRLNGKITSLQEDSAQQLDRPLNPLPDFDWHSAYGLYIMGRDEARSRDYSSAEVKIRQSIQKEAGFMPALTVMAFLQYRKMQYDSAFYFAQKALSIDTYDPAANYYYGLSAEKLDKWYNAADGFEIAALTADYRVAAYVSLSRIYLQRGNYQKAHEYACYSQDYDGINMSALNLRYLAGRLIGNEYDEKAIKQKILKLDPLNHFIRFEEYWEHKNKLAQEVFANLIRNELPQETYLELAIWYYMLNRPEECKALLKMAPQNNELQYWLAYMHKDEADSSKWLKAATLGTARLVFPFREETVRVMQWAISKTNDWKPRYYLALIHLFRNNQSKARRLLNEVTEKVDFAPFYITRALLYDSSEANKKLSDLSTALNLDKDEWRFNKYLVDFLLKQKEYSRALQTVEPYFKIHPNNYIIGMLYVRCLMLNDQYEAAEKILGKVHILPYEGALDGRKLYRETKLMLALNALKKNQFRTALQKVKEAGDWPRNLGVGKPYQQNTDTILEDSLNICIHEAINNKVRRQLRDYSPYVFKIKAISGDIN